MNENVLQSFLVVEERMLPSLEKVDTSALEGVKGWASIYIMVGSSYIDLSLQWYCSAISSVPAERAGPVRVSDVLHLLLVVWVLPGAGLWQDSVGWLHRPLHGEQGEPDGL